jgi:hypothetical protein
MAYPPLDRPRLFRCVGKFDELFVDSAPAPAFRRAVTFDDRATGRVKMRGLSLKNRPSPPTIP